MESQQIIFLMVVFGVVFGLALLALSMFSPSRSRKRLAAISEPSSQHTGQPEDGWIERVAKVAKPFAKLSLPEEGWENSPLRTRFMNAGWRNPSSPAVYLAAKTVLAAALPLIMTVFASPKSEAENNTLFFALLLFCAVIGYYLPNGLLSRAIEKRQLEIFESFPDALDLLTVCVEAGLSLDQALHKVADEIHVKSPVLAEELQLVLMEMRAGFSKEKALRNLALRTGVEDIDTLVAMLVQAERFGTSMGASLRVHSDGLRTKRRYRAEEAAAKIALKLLFPLIFFIFPTLLVVLMGPAFIQIYRVLLPTFSGVQ
ncbi:type II secretion system F family protein [Oxalobacteraceae bacterium R-40]|uniref:Type II secretion system F family protein n=1 Tax=Keguizhuia sedimenti TaxID=3064264 RepID=A0ABU1BIU3_9BURK|nr:type II secretion system F family protein [Oxalobacteraceae bacterium R-40]